MAGRGTPGGGVLIDISHLGAEEVERRFPGMVARTRQIGADLARGPVEVSPTAHFHMGGAIIDPDCRTAIPGLLVAGEDAGGVHGANRLGGNGVAESTVFGCRAGDTAAVLAHDRGFAEASPATVQSSFETAIAPFQGNGKLLPFDLTRRLKDTMWNNCGVERSRESLLDAAAELHDLWTGLDQVSVPGPVAFNPAWQEALDLRNQLTVAAGIVECALRREETRGAHARSDFPNQRDDLPLNYLVVRHLGDDEFEVDARPVEFTRRHPELAQQRMAGNP
jgi:succinate dehydrogenase / fumarate reductase flavoprotein subunit/fumarate reductase flavoprotein subunit